MAGAFILPILLFAVIATLKVPIKQEEEVLVKQGMVMVIFEGGVNDHITF